MSAPLVLYEKREGIARITLNRPAQLNAMNLAMRDELWEAWLAVRDDPDVRVAVLIGTGDRAFCAGADVTEFGTAPSYVAARRARHERDLWGLMLTIDKPKIAAIHGFALGAGCEMSLHCDLRIAAEDARFGLPEVVLGYIPSAGGTPALPRHIALATALDMVLTGDPIDAQRALAAGLVHRVVPGERLESEALALAGQLCRRPAAALAAARRAVYEGLDMPLAESLALNQRLATILARTAGEGALTALAASAHSEN